MSGHTPGPWTIDIDPPRRIGGEKCWDDHGGYRINAPGVEQLAYVWNASNRLLPGGGEGPTFGSNESEANARLIAAAPELLEACKQAESAISEHDPFGTDLLGPLRVAIAKATGGES